MGGIEFFDPVKLVNRIHHARMYEKSEVRLFNDGLCVPLFYKKMPDMSIEWRRCYLLNVAEGNKSCTLGRIVVDHYVGDGDADYDSSEVLRLKLDGLVLSRGHVPRCYVEILANGETPVRKDYARGLVRKTPADFSGVLPTEWFLASRVVSS